MLSAVGWLLAATFALAALVAGLELSHRRHRDCPSFRRRAACCWRTGTAGAVLLALVLLGPSVASAYVSLLASHMYLANSLVGGTVMTCGDTLAQRVEHRGAGGAGGAGTQFVLDRRRVLVCACFSAGAHMPINTLWYHEVVERVLPDESFSGELLAAAAWTLVKAVAGVTPAWVLMPLFFVWVPVGENLACLSPSSSARRSASELREHIHARLRYDLLRVIRNAYTLWVPANLVMLTVTRGRPQYRVAVIALVSLVWKTYVTLVEHGPTKNTETNKRDGEMDLER